MKHIEYKKASMRHLSTCDILLKSISGGKPEERLKIIHNIYYLSGYIIETSLNYAFFSAINYTKHIEDHPLYTSKGIKSHNFDAKIRHIRQNNGDLSGLPFISNSHQNLNLEKLYKNWSTDLRYYFSGHDLFIDYNTIEGFLREIKTLHSKILRRF